MHIFFSKYIILQEMQLHSISPISFTAIELIYWLKSIVIDKILFLS